MRNVSTAQYPHARLPAGAPDLAPGAGCDSLAPWTLGERPGCLPRSWTVYIISRLVLSLLQPSKALRVGDK